MRKRNVRIILAGVAVSAVLGVGVAAAATSQSSWTSGQGAQMTNAAGTTRNGDGLRMRARDGTGPRHLQTQGAAQQGCALATGRARDTSRGVRAPGTARTVPDRT